VSAHPNVETVQPTPGRWQASAWGDHSSLPPTIAYGDTEADALRELALVLLRELLEVRERVYTGEF
jgi:hypothetical protein